VQHRDAAVQEPVPEVKTSFDKARPRLAAANPVKAKATLGLKIPHRL
jgi:hypothetical protein